MIITIDGPSGSGKSTVAKILAEKLGYECFDTGAMYRAVTWYISRHVSDFTEEDTIKKLLESFLFEIGEGKNKEKIYFVNSVDVTKAIRSHEVTGLVSEISKIGYIRSFVVNIQRKIGSGKEVIFEGRDMGTVVFPYADVKFFLSASSSIRARRRYMEISAKFPDDMKKCDYNQILKNIQERDSIDSTRKISPLKQAKDAILVDTSALSTEQVVSVLLKTINKVAKKRSKGSFAFKGCSLLYIAILFSVRFLFKIFYRFQVVGQDKFIKGPAIIASNHSSFYDPPAVACACPEEIHFLARKTLFKRAWFAWLIRKLNSHPVSLEKGGASGFKTAIAVLKKGNKILVFPEGRRSIDGKIKKIMKGTAFLSYVSKAPIIPVYVTGTGNIWKKTKKLPKLFGKIKVVIGKPIYYSEFNDLSKEVFTEQVTQKLEESLIDLQDKCAKDNFI